jgi:hypothetical protein
MHGFQQGGLRPRRRRRRQFNPDGERLAVKRGLTGAKLYLAGWFPSLKTAAEAVGAGVDYVRAAVALLRAENTSLLRKVLAGETPMLAAARGTLQLAAAVAAYKAMVEADRKAFASITGATADLTDHLARSVPSKRAEAARGIGAEAVWEQMVLPLITEDRSTVS